MAFENHDHTYKRTYPIKHALVVPDGEGTVYLGDGCWGKPAREVAVELPPYLRDAASVEHFWVADFGPERAIYRAVDVEGRVFDVYPEDAEGAEAARRVMKGIPRIYRLPRGSATTEGFLDVGQEWRGGRSRLRCETPLLVPLVLW